MHDPESRPHDPPSDGLAPSEALDLTTHSFIVVIRYRSRPSGNRPAAWIGSVEHAPSRDRTYFVDFKRLNEFIATHCGIPLPKSSSLTRVRQRLTRLLTKWK